VDAYFGIDDEMLKGKRREGFLYKELWQEMFKINDD
jgi:hypothetical protein